MTTTTFSNHCQQRVVLPYPPTANLYWRRAGVRIHVSHEARQYKDKAAKLAVAQGMKPLSGDVAVMLCFYRPRKRGDLDNMLKVMLDALKGIAYHDDKQVAFIQSERRDDKHQPRVEVMVEPVKVRKQRRKKITARVISSPAAAQEPWTLTVRDADIIAEVLDPKSPRGKLKILPHALTEQQTQPAPSPARGGAAGRTTAGGTEESHATE